jgi:hypothetical protein
MRLPAPFIKLPLRFDTTRLKAEIGQFPESEWRGHPQGFPGNSALVLVSREGGDNDDTSGSMAPTPRLARCEYLRQVMESFQTVIGRSRLMRLEPGAEVTPHTDIDFYWRDRVRIHVPIVTDPSVRFNCHGVEIHMAEGEAWIFDNWRPHHVINGSGIRRVHLVIDTVGSAAFWRMASSGMPAGGGTPPAELITYRPDTANRLVYERSNTAPLAHPAAVKSAVLELVADLRSAPPQSPEQPQLENTLLDFTNEWQALWAQFADQPQRHGEFAVFLEDTLRQVAGLGREIRLPSNSTPVNQVLQRFLPAMFEGLDGWLKSVPKPRFKRPVIIVSAPRSGSTLLFETLKRHSSLWTLGDESHAEIENIPGLSPRDRRFESNVLAGADLTTEVQSRALENFTLQLRDNQGRRWLTSDARPEEVRLLEKTPKNALRIPFLDAMFPDALFIFLYRDTRENLGSVMDAWESGRFVTYPDLPGWTGMPWSLMLPQGWRDMKAKPLADIAVYQWRSANSAILDALEGIPQERWRVIDYAALLQDPQQVFGRACDFLGIPRQTAIESDLAKRGLPLSRYTLTPPDKNKWRRHEKALMQVLPGTEKLIQRLEQLGNRL